MQQSMQATRTGSGRREERVRDERVPFEASVEVRTDDSTEPRKADGLNVSIGGLAMRASTVPPLGATVACRFACPPAGEPISAKGEVVWSSPAGVTPGSFGVRFIELDTKSATCLRRYLGPRGELTEASGRLRSATIRIDGLGPSVEAELKLADETRVVLEQELSFLQLGRAVEVSVQGRGTERGRIASVELRRSHYDVPTIVYGVLLDSAPVREAEPGEASAAPAGTPSAPALTESAELPIAVRMSLMPPVPTADSERVTGRVSSPPRVGARRSESPVTRMSTAPRRDTMLAAPVPPPPPEPAEERTAMVAPPPVDQLPPASAAHSHSRAYTPQDTTAASAPSAAARQPVSADADGPTEQPGADEDELEDTVYEPRAGAMAVLRGLPLQVGLLTRALAERVRAFARQPGPSGEAPEGTSEALEPSDPRTRWLLRVARLRGLMLAIWSWLRGLVTGNAGPASSRPPLRMQRATLPGIAPGEDMRSEASPHLRIAIGVLIACGLGAAIYMLTPGGSDAEIKLPEPPVAAPEPAASEAEEPLVLELDGRPEPEPELEAEPPAARRRATKASKSAEAVPVAEADVPAHELGDSAELPSDPPAAAGPAVFGDAEVPNGRIFTLRMNGPVTALTGQPRDHGFTVRIPNRVAADRASPIATAHSAVARAMILNRPGFAELTIEFRPGQAPRYQVRGTGNALEITLERL